MIRERAVKVVVVIVGLLFSALIYPWAMILWQRRASEYAEAMMLSLYMTLGVFLLAASRNPSAHRSLVGFAAWSSFAHASTMAMQALTDVSDRAHLLFGVVLFAVVGGPAGVRASKGPSKGRDGCTLNAARLPERAGLKPSTTWRAALNT